MNKSYNLKLDLQFRCNNSIMKFNQFDNETSDFFIRITNGGKLFDIEKAIVVLAVIKPNKEVDSQFIEIENGVVYANLKPSMKDEIGIYTARAMLILESEKVVTDIVNYEVEEDKIFSLLNDSVEATEEYTLLTDMLSRLSTIEISEEQRMINEAERILSEENRKIEEAKRVEVELVRQHEEADRAKYDAIRESNENIRKQNESIRLANETNRIDEEAKRVEEENKRKLAEEERNANYNFMTEDEERRRLEANAHKEAEVLRVQAETNRVNEEAKRRTTEQARVSAENTRVSNENTRKSNEIFRENNETQRIEAETQRQNRYNSFIVEAETNANNFENYTNNAKVKEEERKSNELDRQTQENKRVSNEVERISNENTREVNEEAREKNETSRQNVFENKVSEVDEKISELNTTKDNFISSVNTKVDNKISEIEVAKYDITTTVSNKIDEVENRFNALTSKQQQDAEVIDARDGETSLKARLDRDIEKTKQVYVNVEGSHISTDSSVGYLKDVEILGNTIQDANNLADIRSVGDTVEGQELYEIPVLSCGKNLFDGKLEIGGFSNGTPNTSSNDYRNKNVIRVKPNTTYGIYQEDTTNFLRISTYDENINYIQYVTGNAFKFTTPSNCVYINFHFPKGTYNIDTKISIVESDNKLTTYIPYIEDKLTILSPTPLEKVGDVADRIIEKDGVWGVEKNVETHIVSENDTISFHKNVEGYTNYRIENILNINDEQNVLTNKFKLISFDALFNGEDFGFATHIENKHLYVRTNVYNDINLFKELVSGMVVKKSSSNPQFIPLPHDQQVKLRTFANKTNISFLTEIEGTIKAQVPKSLGATVNTHTEQISNLNKELDRVKKLEESTVSTVETESDFTTVEATSNGYFEDVKLEGKTLVNEMNVLGSDLTLYSSTLLYHNAPIGKFKFKDNTLYTLIILGTTSNFNGKISIKNITGGQITTSNFICKFTTGIVDNSLPHQIHLYGANFTENDKANIKVVCLEGDHTQNPPSYFEGLKSVGQSATTSEDGTDEIVVSSVNDNINNMDNSFTEIAIADGKETTVKSIITTGFNLISVDDGAVYLYRNGERSSNVVTRRYYSKNKVYLGATYTDDACYVRFRFLNASGNYEGDISEYKVLNSTMKEGQSDKKRLLYYNNETQTWEKPVLREWDSIEKHADGKYYYHQRSAEVVLNGSENWVLRDTRTYTLSLKLGNISNLSSTNINDKFIVNANVNADEESLNTLSSYNEVVVSISKSKLSTQDVQGFKQWLQTNNVIVVYQLAEEKVYECTNIDLITYANETNYIVESGAIVPKSTLKVHNNISNVVSLLQKKVSLLESNITNYMITQNRMQLASTYSADSVTFKVDYALCSEETEEYNEDLYNLILNNILVGKDNYNYDKMFNMILDYASWNQISWEQFDILVGLMDIQHNPPIEEIPTDDEIIEEIPNEIM